MELISLFSSKIMYKKQHNISNSFISLENSTLIYLLQLSLRTIKCLIFNFCYIFVVNQTNLETASYLLHEIIYSFTISQFLKNNNKIISSCMIEWRKKSQLGLFFCGVKTTCTVSYVENQDIEPIRKFRKCMHCPFSLI